MSTERYDEWNRRPKMKPQEFATWQEEWHARERAENLGMKFLCSRKLSEQLKSDPIPVLGTPIDIWFLKSCGISTEGL